MKRWLTVKKNIITILEKSVHYITRLQNVVLLLLNQRRRWNLQVLVSTTLFFNILYIIHINRDLTRLNVFTPFHSKTELEHGICTRCRHVAGHNCVLFGAELVLEEFFSGIVYSREFVGIPVYFGGVLLLVGRIWAKIMPLEPIFA